MDSLATKLVEMVYYNRKLTNIQNFKSMMMPRLLYGTSSSQCSMLQSWQHTRYGGMFARSIYKCILNGTWTVRFYNKY